MEKEEKKKKKLTLSVSSKKLHNVTHYAQSKGKTSVVIEKKTPRRWGEKKFQSRSNFNKPKLTGNFTSKSSPINRNFSIRKIAEERATKRFKNLKEESLQPKKSNLVKTKGSTTRREYKLTLSKALDDEALEGKERSLASVRRARLKEKKILDSEDQKIETKKNC